MIQGNLLFDVNAVLSHNHILLLCEHTIFASKKNKKKELSMKMTCLLDNSSQPGNFCILNVESCIQVF